MANVASQQYQQQPSANSGYYGTTNATYQQQHGGGNYSYGNYGPTSSQQHTTYWSGQSGGYTNNQPENYFSRGTSSQQASCTAAYPRSHWYNKSQQRQQNCYAPNPPSVATGNRSSMKRTYATDTALHDITNGTNAPKRRKYAPINTTHAAQVLPNGVPRNGTIARTPTASSIDQQTRKVRIESIFRHVELLAQSYWQTGNCSAASSALKPTTVDAFEGGPMSTLR